MQALQISQQQEQNEFMTLQSSHPEQAKKEEKNAEPVKVWEDLPFFDYFASKTKGKQNLLLMDNKYNKKLQEQLQHQIQEGKTSIFKSKKPIVISQKKQESMDEKFRRQRLQLSRKKEAFKQSLSQVLQQEHNLLSKNISILRNSRHRSQSNFESLNPNWKQEIASSLKKFKQFENAIKLKESTFQEKIRKMRQIDQMNKIRTIQQMKLKNKNQLIQKQIKYRRLKEQEINQRKKCKLTVSRLKPEEYKFRQIELKKYQYLRKVQSQRQLQLQTIRKQKISFRNQDLQAHENAYFEIMNQRKQQWITQFQSFKAQQRSKVRHYSGLYSDRIIQEEMRLKEEAEKGQEKKYEAVQRVKEFSQYVKDHFKPKKMLQSNPEKQENKEIHQSLSRVEQRSKGIQNLQYIKEIVKKLKTTSQKHQKPLQKAASLPKLKSQTVYKDYLKQQPSRVRREMSTKQDFQSALVKRKQNWLQNAYEYIQKVQKKQKIGKSKPLIETAFRKLELLNALY